ncbi:roadblock/LC7 domain-containing protein [Dactylosporangium sp. AC04546]|uniref:roadblock/LC7 domain-containing protein n=1 Tax=Dactylosporangium sp. AC04546 TaxID=2862460 RepID=UPI001EDEF620|nr:roadblock/LC7 domain-containing protein [Dactylosporangium sp. AC04546]WVK88332.1 roadblock/LC7 domain-containing protein [Dactylosporangium sp. AC04546]
MTPATRRHHPASTGQVAQVLANLRAEVPLVRQVMLATSDGLPMFEGDRAQSEPHEAALSATILALGSQVGATVGGGVFIDCVIRSTEAVVCVLAIADRHVMAVTADAKVNLGLLLQQSRVTAEQLVPLVPYSPR